MIDCCPFPVARDVATIVEDLGAVYADGRIVPVDEREVEESQLWNAQVTIRGPWNGAVILSCRREFAVRATSDILGIELTEVSDEEATDVIGELANMIGGGLKAIISASVGGTCCLSQPSVSRGRCAPPEMEDRPQQWFLWREQLFSVRLLEMLNGDPARHSVHPTLQ